LQDTKQQIVCNYKHSTAAAAGAAAAAAKPPVAKRQPASSTAAAANRVLHAYVQVLQLTRLKGLSWWKCTLSSCTAQAACLPSAA
jgi:hypothetical protein